MNNFAESCKLSFEEWLSNAPNYEDFPEPQYSKKHTKRMERLFDQMRGNTYHRYTSKTVKIMFVAAVITALMLCAFIIPSSREYLLENFDLFGMFEITEHNGNTVSDEIEVGYVPEGYELVKKNTTNKTVEYTYESANSENLYIRKYSSSATIKFNTEGGNIEEITIDNITYSYSTNSATLDSIIWTENDYIYQIEGNLSKEEMFKIAENLK